MRRRCWIMVLCLAALALTACGGREPDPPAEEPPQTVYGPQAPDPQPEEPVLPAGVNPLTGLPLEPELENCRPAAVILNNLKAAQPQLGVSQADILYEVPAEGGITRMLAVYQSLEGIGDLGSVRSARPCFLELALGHDALLVHAGGSPEAYRNLSAWGVDNLDGVQGGERGELFWRDPDRRRTMGYEHSLLISGERIQTYLEGGRYRTEHQADYEYEQPFTEGEAVSSGEAAEHVTLRFSYYKTGVFDYDANVGVYLASQYGGAYTDGANGEQVAAVNLLVLETDISVIPGDEEGRLSIRLTGQGAGTYFWGGQAVPIRWSKADRNSPFVYTLENGSLLELAKGNSYVCLMSPKTSTLSYE